MMSKAQRHGVLLALIIGAIVLTAPAAQAQGSATASTGASAVVHTGITIGATTALDFGSLIPGATGGDVVLTAAGARSATGTVTLAAGAFSAGAFLVNETGAGTKKFWIRVPTSITINRAGGGASMTINSLTTNISPNCVSTTGAQPPGPQGGCPSASNFTLNIGGTLAVGASQLTGTYTGLYTVTVNRW